MIWLLVIDILTDLIVHDDCFPEFDRAQGNPGTNNTACTNMQNWLQQSQSSQKALPKSVAQTSQPQHQSVVHIDLTAESDSRKALLHSPKPISKKTKENPTIGV